MTRNAIWRNCIYILAVGVVAFVVMLLPRVSFGTGDLTPRYDVNFVLDEYVHTLEGGTSVELCDLMESLGAYVEDTDITAVDVSCDKIVVEHGGTWSVKSVGSFIDEETMTVSTASGLEYAISMFDPVYVTDLSDPDVVVKVAITIGGDDVVPGDGETHYYKDGTKYSLKLSFRETPEKQFMNDAVLTYPAPDGFIIPDGESVTFSVNMGRKGQLANNTLTYNASTGNLEIRWNTEDSRMYEIFKSASNATINLEIQGTIQQDADEVVFVDGSSINVQKQDNHNATISKDGQYDINEGVVRYTVTVFSDGTTNDLYVHDVPGIGLIYNDDCVVSVDPTLTNCSSADEVVILREGVGFSADIPYMKDGEYITFEYTCRLDVTNIEESGNATFDETGNTVTVTGDDIPDDNVATHHEKNIEFSDIMKSVTSVSGHLSDDEGNYRLITWNVRTNTDPTIPLGGTTITDTVEEDVAPLSQYWGDGIQVIVRSVSDEVVDIRNVSWEEMGTDLSVDTWTYTIPETDDVPYSYEVIYQTRIDLDMVTSETFVENVVSGKGGRDRAYAIVYPIGRAGLGVSKRAIEYDTTHAVWRVDITLNGEAYDADHLTFTEMNIRGWEKTPRMGLPEQWFYSRHYRETLDYIEVEGLEGDECWEFVGNKDGQSNPAWEGQELVINFYKDSSKTEGNINRPDVADGEDDTRTITLYLHTSYPEDWVKDLAELEPSGYTKYFDHVNVADVNGVKATDTISPRPVKVYKMLLRNAWHADKDKTRYVADYTQDPADGLPIYEHKHQDDPAYIIGYGGHVYSPYNYQVLVTGVNSDEPIVIEDVFDTSVFKVLEEPIGGKQVNPATRTEWYDGTWARTYFGAGDTYTWASTFPNTGGAYEAYATNPSAYKVEETETGVRFTFLDVPKRADGSYYQYYGVSYWLVAKDADALARIEQRAVLEGREITLTGSEGGRAVAGETAQVIDFDNVASYKGMSDNELLTIPVEDFFQPVGKSMEQEGTSSKMHCVIELNKERLTLNNGLPMLMEDDYSDTLSIDFQTLTVKTYPEQNASQVSYDFSNNLGSFQIPDNTHVIIEYDAYVLGEIGQDIEVYNWARMIGHEDGEARTVSIRSAGGATADIVSLMVHKYPAGHMEGGINGVQFQLYKVRWVGEERVLEPMTYGNNIPLIFTTRHDDVSGMDGIAEIMLAENVHGMTLQRGQEYALVELRGEANEDYVDEGHPWYFIIAENGSVAYYEGYVYSNGDTMTVRNVPKSQTLTLSKKWAGNVTIADAVKNQTTFTILKYNSSTKAYETIKKVVNDTVMNEDNPAFTNISYADFISGSYDVTGLEVGKYKVVENVPASIRGAQYYTDPEFLWDDNDTSDTFEITVDDIKSGISRQVSITNEYNKEVQTLTVQKVWKNTNGRTQLWPEGEEVQLGLFRVFGAGTPWEEILPYLKADGKPYVVTLDGKVDTDGEIRSGVAEFKDVDKPSQWDTWYYVVKEVSTHTGYTTVYLKESEWLEVDPYERGVVVNQQESVDVEVTKRWSVSQPPENTFATFRLFSRASESDAFARVMNVSDITVTADDMGPGATHEVLFQNLPKYDADGNLLEYAVREIDCIQGFEPEYPKDKDYASDGEEIVNNEKPMTISLKKVWKNPLEFTVDWPDDEAIVVRLTRYFEAYDEKGNAAKIYPEDVPWAAMVELTHNAKGYHWRWLSGSMMIGMNGGMIDTNAISFEDGVFSISGVCEWNYDDYGNYGRWVYTIEEVIDEDNPPKWTVSYRSHGAQVQPGEGLPFNLDDYPEYQGGVENGSEIINTQGLDNPITIIMPMTGMTNNLMGVSFVSGIVCVVGVMWVIKRKLFSK